MPGRADLVDEVLPFLDGAEHIEIRGEPYGVSTPYRSLRDPVRRLLGIERDVPEVMAERLKDSLTSVVPDRLPLLPLIADLVMIEAPSTSAVDEIEPRFRQDRTADLLVELVARINSGAVFFEVEDGHFLDPASSSMMSRIARATRDHPWLLITTRRGGPHGFDPELGEIRLGPLTDDEARELVLGATAAAPLRTHDIDALVDRAGGLPLFLEELVAAMRQTGGLAALPDSLEAVISAQIDALPPLAGRLLLFSSVPGRSFRVATANQLLEEEGIGLDHATRTRLSGFLETEPHGRLRFRALESAGRLTGVGDTARADVWTSLGDVSELAGRFEDALEAYRRASRLVGDEPLRRVDLLLRRARVRRRSASYAAALSETSQGLKLIAGDSSPDGVRARARLTAERAAIRRWQQRPGDALD